ARSPMPIIRRPLPTLCSLGGMRILMASFFRKPSGLPVTATALPVLICSASLSPAIILSLLRPAVLCWFRASLALLIMSPSWAGARSAQNRRAIRKAARIFLDGASCVQQSMSLSIPTKIGQQCVLWNREVGCELQEKLVHSSLAVGAAGNCRIRAAAVLAFASLAAESHFVAVCVRDP